MNLWRHQNCRDTAFEVVKKFYVKEKRTWSLKVLWWNIGTCHAPFCMNIAQRLSIPDDTWRRDWHPFPINGRVT